MLNNGDVQGKGLGRAPGFFVGSEGDCLLTQPPLQPLYGIAMPHHTCVLGQGHWVTRETC